MDQPAAPTADTPPPPRRTLADAIAAGSLEWRHCADLGAELCVALDRMHGTGVAHGAITPSAVLLDDVGGFTGLAVPPSDAPGDPRYAAPEILEGQAPDPASDQYAVAAVVYEAAVGRPPFTGTAQRLRVAHATEPPPDPRTVRPTVPAPAASALLRGLAKAPGERFPDLAAMAQDLRRSTVRRPWPALPATPAGSRRRISVRTGALVAVPLLAGALVGALLLGGLVGQPESRDAVTAAQLSLTPPAGWTRGAAVPPDLRRLGIRAPILLTARGDVSRGLIAGIGAATGRTLVTPEFREALDSALPAQRPARLGRITGMAYPLVATAGGRRLTVTVAPTTAGVLTVACFAPVGGPDPREDCSAVLPTVRLRGGVRTTGLGPDPAYAARLRQALTTFNHSSAASAATLGNASSRAAQVSAADRLADQASALGRDLGAIRPALRVVDDHRRLTAAARTLASRAQRLQAAGHNGDAAAWSRAAEGVRSARVELASAVEALGGLGYRTAD